MEDGLCYIWKKLSHVDQKSINLAMETIITPLVVGSIGALASIWLKSFFDHKTHKSKTYHDSQIPIIKELYGNLSIAGRKLNMSYFGNRNMSFEEFSEQQKIAQQFYSRNILYIDKKIRKDIQELLDLSFRLVGSEVLYDLEFRKGIPIFSTKKDEAEESNLITSLISEYRKESTLLMERIELNFIKQIK